MKFDKTSGTNGKSFHHADNLQLCPQMRMSNSTYPNVIFKFLFSCIRSIISRIFAYDFDSFAREIQCCDPRAATCKSYRDTREKRFLLKMSSSSLRAPRRARADLLRGLTWDCLARAGFSMSGLILKGYTAGLVAGPRDECWVWCWAHPKPVRCRFRAGPGFLGKFDISNLYDKNRQFFIARKSYQDVNLKFGMPKQWHNILETRRFFYNFTIATFGSVQIQFFDI